MIKVIRFMLIFVLLLSISHPILASDDQLKQLVGQKAIFLPLEEVDRKDGYKYCKVGPGYSYDSVKYAELVGKTAIITSVNTTFNIAELQLEDGKIVYILGFSEYVPYIGLFSDLEEAQKTVGKTLWCREECHLVDKDNPQTRVDLPRFTSCKVLEVGWGLDASQPVSITMELGNKKLAIWGGAATGLNPATFHLKKCWYIQTSVEDSTIDQTALAQVTNQLRTWKNILAYTDESYVSYFALKPETLKLIGSSMGDFLFDCRATDTWNGNKEALIYLSAAPNKGQWEYCVSTGQDELPYYQDEINPPLDQNKDIYYMTVNDQSKCPLRILAYGIILDDGMVTTYLVVKNTSQKGIIAFTGSFLMYDKMNHPVTWGGGTNEFKFLCQESPLPGLSRSMEVGPWELTLYGKTRIIKPYIREIRFKDGTTWKRS